MQTEIFIQAPTCGPREAGDMLASCLRDLQVTKSFAFGDYRRWRVVPNPVERPPEDFHALREHVYSRSISYELLKPVRSMSTSPSAHIDVWSGGSEDTIYLRPDDNYRFRALHAAYHVELNSGFDLAGELRVSLAMYEDLRLRGMQDAPTLAYLIDTVGQSLMHFLTGEHVPDQLAFVTAVWDRMLPKMREEPIRVSILPLLEETVRNLSKGTSMTMRTSAHKNTEHPAAQVPTPERFLHPTLGPLVAREVAENCCINFRTRDECAAFGVPGTIACPNHFGGPRCHPNQRRDGKPIIWIRDPAYVKGAQ